MRIMFKNKLILILLTGISLSMPLSMLYGGSEHGPDNFISPRVAIEETALKNVLSPDGQRGISIQSIKKSIFQKELALNQPLVIARRLIDELPTNAAQMVLNELSGDRLWKVLKKLPVSFISIMLDTLNPQESGRIIQQMRPLKAGLVLGAMYSAESVFQELSLSFQTLLLNTPGPRQIVHATIEESDFFRCGGLADVLKNLPRETAEQGDISSVFMPLWSGINKEFLTYVGYFTVPIDSSNGYRQERIDLFYTETGDIVKYRVYFIENHTYFDVGKDEVFSGQILERFIVFDKAVIEAIRYLGMRPDIIHCHEWQTGLIPVYVKAFYQEKGVEQFKNTLLVYSSHNPVYDMKDSRDSFSKTGLDANRFFRFDGLEINGFWSFSKAGFLFSDMSNTVSQSMAEDVLTQDFIGGIRNDLKGVYQYLQEQGRWKGIVNGGNEHFRAEINAGIAYNFDVSHLDARIENKMRLQKNLGLEVNPHKPIIGIIGRLTGQKGYDLLLPILMDILERGGQFVSLGSANQTDPTGWHLQNQFRELIEMINTDPKYEKYRDQISMNFVFGRSFDDGTNLEALICSGADIVTLPSRFEPCGLVQMNAAGCGGVVVAHKIQGLADTIAPYDRKTGNGLGFVFEGYSSDNAFKALLEAMDLFRDEPETWRHIQKNNMNADFSWDPVFWEYRNIIYSRARSAFLALGPQFNDFLFLHKSLQQNLSLFLQAI